MPLDVKTFFGPILIGVLLGCILYGILVTQVFFYHQSFRKYDAVWIRCFIWYLFIFESIATVIQIGVIFDPLISHYGTTEAVTITPILFPSGPLLTVLVSVPVQIFTAWRIYVLTRGKIVTALIVLLALTSFGSGIEASWITASNRDISKKHKLNHPIFLVAAAVTDILITVSLVYSLYKRKTGIRSSTDLTINRIIRWTLQTGTITTVFALADAIAIFVSPKTAISFAFDFAIAKLYSNALLSTLNARSIWRARDAVQFSTLNFSAGTPHDESGDDNVLFGRDVGAVSVSDESRATDSSGRYLHPSKNNIRSIQLSTRDLEASQSGPSDVFELRSRKDASRDEPRSESGLSELEPAFRKDSLSRKVTSDIDGFEFDR